MEYYKTRYVPNNLTFVVVGDVDGRGKCGNKLAEFFKDQPAKSLEPDLYPSRAAATWTARSASGICDGVDASRHGLARSRNHSSRCCPRSICCRSFSAKAAARDFIAGCARKRGWPLPSPRFPTLRAIPEFSVSMRSWIRRIAKRPRA